MINFVIRYIIFVVGLKKFNEIVSKELLTLSKQIELQASEYPNYSDHIREASLYEELSESYLDLNKLFED